MGDTSTSANNNRTSHTRSSVNAINAQSTSFGFRARDLIINGGTYIATTKLAPSGRHHPYQAPTLALSPHHLPIHDTTVSRNGRTRANQRNRAAANTASFSASPDYNDTTAPNMFTGGNPFDHFPGFFKHAKDVHVSGPITFSITEDRTEMRVFDAEATNNFLRNRSGSGNVGGAEVVIASDSNHFVAIIGRGPVLER
ncbi:hypothetical protein M413DRAFT_22018 [Hebeloma cylindrosporum]|uniref:Uncharacterized protein n=1 Tax=Hebeloma cylindrosporum TaxID=76867 RepID=A0A0C3D0G5_HEBCY|nr:hypothetical protein M413DRAFT_22018 [Hebeloma cylindrosporum h7]